MDSTSASSLERRTSASFADQTAAEGARQALTEAGFSADQITIQPNVTDPEPHLDQSQAGRSSRAAALVGGLTGGLLGAFIVLVGTSVPNLTTIEVYSGTLRLIVPLLGGLVGAVGAGIVGGFSGSNAPRPDASADRETLSQRYLVIVETEQAKVQPAAELLRSHGGQ